MKPIKEIICWAITMYSVEQLPKETPTEPYKITQQSGKTFGAVEGYGWSGREEFLTKVRGPYADCEVFVDGEIVYMTKPLAEMLRIETWGRDYIKIGQRHYIKADGEFRDELIQLLEYPRRNGREEKVSLRNTSFACWFWHQFLGRDISEDIDGYYTRQEAELVG